MDFVAFDVETANRGRGSICAIGYAVVSGWQVVDSGAWLVNPGPVEFDPWNVRIHGIRPDDVRSAPPIPVAIERLTELIGDRVAVAHNASFDVGAIREATLLGECPTFDYVDTLVMVRRELALISYRLPIVAEALGVPLVRHHAAADDATATAGIAMKLGERQQAGTITELADKLMVQVGRLAPWDQGNRSSRAIRQSQSAKGHAGTPEPNQDADEDHPLYGKVMVFTGALSVPREQAWEMAASVGAIPEVNVTKRTNILVIGSNFVGDNLADFGTGKAQKALMLLEKGQAIEVMNEREFIDALNISPGGANGPV